jgi:hypothetical protein
MYNKVEVIRQIVERCRTEDFHRICGLVKASHEIFMWAEDHSLDLEEVVDKIIEVHGLDISAPVDDGIQHYGRKKPHVDEELRQRAMRYTGPDK